MVRQRLSAENLAHWNTIRMKLAEGDEEFCSGLYTGKVDEETLWRAFEKLPQDDLMLWTKIMIEAGRREWEKVEFAAPPARSLGQGLEQIATALPKEESERLATVLALGNTNSDESACWAMKKILAGTEALPSELKTEFLRSLAIQF